MLQLDLMQMKTTSISANAELKMRRIFDFAIRDADFLSETTVARKMLQFCKVFSGILQESYPGMRQALIFVI